MLSMLGIRQIAVLVNKMDLVGYEAGAFAALVAEYEAFLRHLDVRPAGFVPTCGRDGENIAGRSVAMPWYTGPTVLEVLDRFETEPPALDKPLRWPVQDVYKFTQAGDDRRIVAGTIETGSLKVGDEIVFYPSGKKSHVRTIEGFARPPQFEAGAGAAVGATLHEQVYVARGELATRATDPPPAVTTRLRVSLFWLGRGPLVTRKDYVLKLGTARVPVRVEEILRVVDASTLAASESKTQVERHDVAECILATTRAIAVDLADHVAATSRFVLVDDHEIRGGGIVREALPDRHTGVRERVLRRNLKWEASSISPERRAERYNQRPTLILVTGEPAADRKGLARDLERRLFEEGKVVYFLGIGNVLYGVDADIDRRQENRHEHIRRLAEVANILLEAGVILIVTAAELTQEDLDLVKATVEADRIETVWVGDRVTTDIACDLHLPGDEHPDESIGRIKGLLRERGIIFQPR
jgi:bifunctional enzyme CysN/CysC